MKTNRLWIGVVALAAIGCSAGGGDQGTVPPPSQPISEAKLKEIPPEASASIQASQAQGAAMAAQYNARYSKRQ